MEQVEEVGRDVRYHGERLTQFATAPAVGRWPHLHRLDTIKTLINDNLRPALQRLTEIQAQLPEWKQDGVERILATARELAAHANSAVPTRAEAPPLVDAGYRKLITDMVSHAVALVTTSDAARACARAHVKAAEAGLSVSR